MNYYRVTYLSGSGSSWKDKLRLAAAAVIGAAVLVSALVLSLGILFVLVPVGLVAWLFRRQIVAHLLGRMQPPVPPREAPQPGPETPKRTVTIDGDYTVIDRRR